MVDSRFLHDARVALDADAAAHIVRHAHLLHEVRVKAVLSPVDLHGGERVDDDIDSSCHYSGSSTLIGLFKAATDLRKAAARRAIVMLNMRRTGRRGGSYFTQLCRYV